MESLIPNMCDPDCPTRHVLDLIGDKRVILIVGLLEHEPRRYGALQRQLGGISHTMLTQTLRNLERAGVVLRVVYAERPPRVEYKLTPLGQTLCKPIAAMRSWVEENIQAITAAQARYDRHA